MQSPSRRQRARKACQPCRQRKRKCDGHQPCSTCIRYEYNCYFAESDKATNGAASRDDVAVNSLPDTPSSPRARSHVHPAVLEPYKSRFMQANSSVAFPRLLGIELNSSGNAPRLHSFAWNLGVRQEPRFERPDVVDYISLQQLEPLASVYFSVIHPIFHFIDRAAFTKRCQQRFGPEPTDRRVDPVLYGVAALGSLFSKAEASHAKEAELVELAANVLEHTSTMMNPTLDQISAWILRTIYLRCTTRPHASWLASCTTMHLVEATGLHQEVSKVAILTAAPPELSHDELYLRRRLFWTAHALNKTLSHEYGRGCAKVSNVNVDAILLPDEEPALRDQYVALADILPGDDVSPFDVDGQQILHEAISDLTRLTFTSDEMLLFRADLAFSIYRKMRLSQKSHPGISHTTSSAIVTLGLQALPAASALAARLAPWWTVISVPFQFVCILLAIDSRESLSKVPGAMAVLEDVVRCWDTHMVQEAIGVAALLVKLSRKGKEEDIKCLDQVLQKHGGSVGHSAATAALTEGNGAIETVKLGGGGGGDQVGPANTIDLIEGFDNLPLPDDFSLDWNTFFNGTDWV